MTNFADEKTIKTMIEAYTRFEGTGLYVLLFIASIIFILFNKKIKKNVKIVFGVFSIIIFIINLNPIFAKIYIKILGDGVYWRVYWMLPFAISIAFMLTYIIFIAKEKSRRLLLIVITGLLIVASGEFMYSANNFKKVNNYYKIDDEIVDIVNFVSNYEDVYKKLAGPSEFEIYTRQIDGTILLAMDRIWGDPPKGSIVYYIENVNYKELYDSAIAYQANYIVIENSKITPDDNFSNYGYREIYRNEKYTLYKI